MKHSACAFHQCSIHSFGNTILFRGVGVWSTALDAIFVAEIDEFFWSELTTIIALNGFDLEVVKILNKGFECLEVGKRFFFSLKEADVGESGGIVH